MEPTEAAYQMVEDALEPFADLVQKYRELGLMQEMKAAALGMADGIIEYSNESSSEFRDSAPDDPLEWLRGWLDSWKSGGSVEEIEVRRQINERFERED